MIYADYDFYLNDYAGTEISTADFPRLSRQASAYIDTITYGNAEKATDSKVIAKLSDACCAVAEVMYTQEQGGEVASESNDGASVTYVTGNATPEQQMYNAAVMYLSNAGLLYAGVM